MRWPALLPPVQDGVLTVLSVPQKSGVVPQKPNLEQHTFRGHVSDELHSDPQPGSQSLFASQVLVQFPAPQYEGPRPQTCE